MAGNALNNFRAILFRLLLWAVVLGCIALVVASKNPYLGIGLVLLLVALFRKRSGGNSDSYGSARWATASELHEAGLLSET